MQDCNADATSGRKSVIAMRKNFVFISLHHDRSPRRGIEIVHVVEGARYGKGEFNKVAGVKRMTGVEGNVAGLRVGVRGCVLARDLSDPDVVASVIGEADGLTCFDTSGCWLK